MFVSTQTRSRRLGAPIRRRRLASRLSSLPSAPSGQGWKRYQEIVTARPGPGRYTIYLRPDPAHDRLGLGSLGLSPANLIGPTVVAPSGSTAASAVESAAAGASAGAMFGPIGAGIGAIAGAIAGIWAAHDARVQGATTENKVLSSAVQAWDQSMQTIFQYANSGQITASTAASYVTQVYQSFWTAMCPYTKGPGRADTSNCGANCGNGTLNPGGPCTGTPGGHQCNSACTATCCVGCQDIYPSMLQAIAVFSSTTGGTVQVCNVSGSSFGYSGRSGYSLTYTPPAATTVAGATNSVTSALTGVASVLTGGASSTNSALLPLLLVGALGLGIFALAG